jgi:hypothetical protein
MNRLHMCLLMTLAATLPLGRQARAAEDSDAKIRAIEKQLDTLSNELAQIKAQQSASQAAAPMSGGTSLVSAINC